jgi:hypothetical protein
MRGASPTLDAADPIALAEFYERLLGWSIVRREGPRPGKPSIDGWAMLRSPSGDMKIEVQWDPHYRPPVWPSNPTTARYSRASFESSTSRAGNAGPTYA